MVGDKMALVFSAGIAPVRKTPEGYEYLLLRSHNYWDFPKGKLDEGETHIEAAFRETEEESGLSDIDMKWGRIFLETEPYKTKVKGKKAKKVSRYYLGEVSPKAQAHIPANPETGEKEHEELRWTSYEQAVEMPLRPRIKRILDWAHSKVEGNNA